MHTHTYLPQAIAQRVRSLGSAAPSLEHTELPGRVEAGATRPHRRGGGAPRVLPPSPHSGGHREYAKPLKAKSPLYLPTGPAPHRCTKAVFKRARPRCGCSRVRVRPAARAARTHQKRRGGGGLEPAAHRFLQMEHELPECFSIIHGSRNTEVRVQRVSGTMGSSKGLKAPRAQGCSLASRVRGTKPGDPAPSPPGLTGTRVRGGSGAASDGEAGALTERRPRDSRLPGRPSGIRLRCLWL